MYLRFRGRAIYATLERKPFHTSPWFEHRHQLGEHLFWFGRLSVVYTPRDWKTRREREAKLA